MIRYASWALVLTCFSQTSVVQTVCADVIVADDFLYHEPTKALGTIGGFTQQNYAGGQNGPAGQWTGQWISSGEAVITGLDFDEPDDQFQAIVGDLGVPVNFNFLQRGFQLNGVGADQSIYVSVQSRVGLDALNLPRIWIKAPLDETAQIGMGFVDSGFIAQLGSDFNDSFDEPTNDGEYHTLVGKLEVNRTGSNERLTVWLDPTGPETGESTFIEANVVESIDDLNGVLRLGRLDEQCCGVSGLLYWDNVALGTAWEDVAQIDVPRLTLQVDPETGATTLRNDSATSFDLKYYELHSETGSLNVDAWNSLDDQQTSGDNWMENSPTTHRLTESNFAGTTTLGSGQSMSLGAPFVPTGTRDLVARFATSQGLFNLAMIQYGAITGRTGDFNGDGVLDATDIDALTIQSAGGTHPASFDLNADALVNGADIGVWVRDLFNSWMGDANLDGEFNSSDLVTVLASGTYEADMDAVWSTGDFNGDGRTNSSDLVAALADGGYESGPRASVAAVPEPAGWLLLAVSIIMIDSLRSSGRSRRVNLEGVLKIN
jgi:hypothetical protein